MNKTDYLFHHTPHKVVQVIEDTRITITKSQPLSVTYSKAGALIDDIPEEANKFHKIKSKTYFEDAPRLTFAGKIVPMTSENVNPNMIEIHIGVSMTKGENHFNRKRGRATAKSRANSCPILIILCLRSEAHVVFHKAIERLTPVIIDTEQVRCVVNPHVENMSVEAILNEETPD